MKLICSMTFFCFVSRRISTIYLNHPRTLSAAFIHRHLSTKASHEIPSTMKAAQQTNYGDVRHVLTLRDNVAVPRQLSAKQVLVRVHAASINPIDWKMLYGNLALVVRFSFPHIPGIDLAGVVVDTGSSVKRFRVGDHVHGSLGIKGGSFAEYARANESMLALKPSNLTMEEAAAIPLACETSYGVLFRKISPTVRKGTKLFICGGSAATGLFALQMASAVGATVATTASQRNFSLLQKLGYNMVYKRSDWTNPTSQVLVIDYNAKDFGEELKGENFDAVYDCVGGEQQWVSAQKILKRNGQFITIAGDDTQSTLSPTLLVNMATKFFCRKVGTVFSPDHHQYTMYAHQPSPTNLDQMRINFIENGKVKPLIDTIYDWRKDGAEAVYSLYEKSKSGKAQGKLILKIAE